MELESTISRLDKYKRSIDENHLNDLIDFLYSEKLIDEQDYYVTYQCTGLSLKLHELFKIIESKHNEVERVFKYLKEVFPNIERLVEEERNFRISSVRGGFPKLPPNYITRNALDVSEIMNKFYMQPAYFPVLSCIKRDKENNKVQEVKSKLVDLKWNEKLVIHGMMGYGKSCLINEVLNDIDIRKYFDYYVFWINIGEHHSKDTVFQPLWRLYQTANNIVMNKSIHCPEDVETLKDLLITLFLHPRLNNALIILDDACNEEVLTYFDIKCKSVITTQNKKILREEEGIIFVEVKTGFSRQESLMLFKKSLSIIHDLPAAAEQIHSICKGHPMLISLIGSYLRDNADCAKNNNDPIWEYMKVMFSKGDYNLNEYDNQTEIPTEKIKKCITKLLANGLKEYYHDLAIFMSDVNIPPEVLQVLWNKNRFEVQNIMNKFAEKSLVVPIYHNDLKTYIYGIHDIHLTYLKDVTKSRIVSLHKKLISGYDSITGGNYALLPNDNYTLQYIGYHLFHAEAYEKFDIYFDFKFLEAKIRAIGKQDVLRDMQKYEDFITNKENVLKHKLNQYKEFINRCGNNIYSYEKTDIIQYALGEKKDTAVYKEALKIAKNSEQLYFRHQKPVDEYDNSTINVRDDITCACFVDSPHDILIGTANGKIKLFFEKSEKEMYNFVGHNNGAINKLIVSPDKRYFLSVSIDKTVRLWKFPIDCSRNSRESLDSVPVSPRNTQFGWQDPYTSDKGQVTPKRTFQLNETDDFLISAAFCDQFPSEYRIVTGSHRGNVIVWDADMGYRVHETGPRGYNVPSVIYKKCDSDDKVIFAYEDIILVYKFTGLNTTYDILHNPDCCKFIFLADKKIIAVSEKSITLWENYKMDRLVEKIDAEKYHICSTLTEDSNYLVVSTNLKTVHVWNFEERKLVKEFKTKGLPKSLDTFYDEDKSVHILLIGSDQKTLQQCHILADDNEPKIADDFEFIPYWKKTHALTALVSSNDQIQVFNGSVHISETDVIKSKITCTCFSACGQNVIYGLENGQVHLFNIRYKRTTCIEKNESNKEKSVTFLQCYSPHINRTHSISSNGSGDSLDCVSYEGTIIAIFNNNTVTAYFQDRVKISKQVNKPLLFFNSNKLLVVDHECQIFIWDLVTDSFFTIQNSSIVLPATVSTAAYCSEKNLLSMVYVLEDKYCLDVYNIVEYNCVEVLNQRRLNDKAVSSQFSYDGSLLAVGMTSGDILVWNLNREFKLTTLHLHDAPVEDLLFSKNVKSILVSVGDCVAWWSLKSLQQMPQRGRRPQSIDILENARSDVLLPSTYWADRKCVESTDYLLSCITLHGRTRCVSASEDFRSFLAVDEKGKIYAMEIVAPSCS